MTANKNESGIAAAAFAPDGRRLAAISTGPRDSAGTLASRVLVWDLESGKEERRLDIPWAGSDSGLAFSPDGTRLAGAVGWPTDESPTVKVRVWDAATGAVIMAREFPFASRAIPAFSADGSLLAVAVGEWWGSSEVKVLDISSGKELRSFAGHRNQVHGLVFSPDGRRLASSSAPPVTAFNRTDAEVKLWDVAGGRELLTFPAASRGDLAFSPDGRRLTYVSVAKDRGDAVVQVWDATPMPDGVALASFPARAAEVKLWDLVGGRELLTLQATGVDRIGTSELGRSCLAFGPDGHRLSYIPCGSRRVAEVQVWDATPMPDEPASAAGGR